jgi:hypothetical protein
MRPAYRSSHTNLLPTLQAKHESHQNVGTVARRSISGLRLQGGSSRLSALQGACALSPTIDGRVDKPYIGALEIAAW